MGSRIALIGAGAVLVVAIFVLARPDDVELPTPTATLSAAPSATSPGGTPTGTVTASPTGSEVEVEIEFEDGAVTTPLAAEVPLGAEVVLRISSDVADEVHLHGYDLDTEVPAGGEGEIRFTADAPGVFEVEFHDRGLLLVRLSVAP